MCRDPNTGNWTFQGEPRWNTKKYKLHDFSSEYPYGGSNENIKLNIKISKKLSNKELHRRMNRNKGRK